MFADMMVVIIESCVRASVVLCAAWALTSMMRRASAATRHFVWSCAIAGAILASALGSLGPRWPVLTSLEHRVNAVNPHVGVTRRYLGARRAVRLRLTPPPISPTRRPRIRPHPFLPRRSARLSSWDSSGPLVRWPSSRTPSVEFSGPGCCGGRLLQYRPRG